jgi:hypothetical protein
VIGLQRVRLPVTAVESEHQLRTEALPVGMLADQRLELWHHLVMAAQLQLRLHQLLERRGPEVCQPGDLALDEWLVRDVREGRAAPQRERPLERPNGVLRAALGQLASALGDQQLELVRVELLRIEPQLVAVVAGHDDVGGAVAARPGERLAQVGDVDLQRLRGGCGWMLSPQLVDQPVGAERLVGVEHE